MEELALYVRQKEYFPFSYELFVDEGISIPAHLKSMIHPIAVPMTDNDSINADHIQEVEYDDNVHDANKWYYSVATASGLISGGLDLFWNKGISIADAQNWGREETCQFVIQVAKKMGYQKDDLAGAIRKLESLFHIESDKVTNEFGGGLQHHLRDFGHHPTLAGLAFSILSQFTGCGYGTDTEGNFIIVPFPDDDFIGKTFYDKIYNGTVIWAFHLISDMAGSSQNPGKGTGIPGPILSFLKEISTLPFVKEIVLTYKDDDIAFSKWVSKLFNGTFFKPADDGTHVRFDLRTEMGLAFQIAKQNIPIIINECVVRAMYTLRKFYIQLKINHISSLKQLSELNAKEILPFNNRIVTHMITISSGIFVVISFSKATACAMKKGSWKAGKKGFFKDVLLSVNYAGICRFVLSLSIETKYVIEDVQQYFQSYQEQKQRMSELFPTEDFLQSLILNEVQLNVLNSLKRQKILYDISRDSGENKRKKNEWRIQWEATLADENGKDYPFIREEETLYHILKRQCLLEKSTSSAFLILFELYQFIPYYALSNEESKLRYNSNFEEDIFLKKQKLTSSSDFQLMQKQYKKYLKALGSDQKKPGIGMMAAGLAAGGLAFAFAPQIAVFLAGKTFAGLRGIALINACLALFGGGALAAGGLGMAGGTFMIAGGGMIFGVVGSGAVYKVFSDDKAIPMVTSECAKLLTYSKIVLLDHGQRYSEIEQIRDELHNSIADYELGMIENQEKNQNKQADKNALKNQKICLERMKKCDQLLLKMLISN